MVKDRARRPLPLTGYSLSALYFPHYMVCAKRFKSQGVADAYVDDTDAATIDKDTQKSDTPLKIRDRLQTIAQTWADLLFGSGGELSKDKTSWYLIWWTWANGIPHMATSAEAPAELKVRVGRDLHLSTIQRKEPTASIKQLGVTTNPVGDFST
eukprot:9556185-Ditylum_brightwellii.AAC.1